MFHHPVLQLAIHDVDAELPYQVVYIEGRNFHDNVNMDGFTELGYKNGIYLINGTGGNHIFHHVETIFHLLLPCLETLNDLYTCAVVLELMRFYKDGELATCFL